MSGIIRRRPDQRYDPPAAPLAPSTAAGVLRARLVIIFGASGGLFVYFGAPALGNLIASIAATSGTDAFGNAYLGQGFAAYNPTGGAPADAALLMAGQSLQLFTAPGPGGAWSASSALGFQAGGSPQWQVLHGTQIQYGDDFGIVRHIQAFPSIDTSGVTDSANIASAFSTLTNPLTGVPGVVELMPGTWYTDQPVVIPDQCGLACGLPSWATPSGNYGAGGLALEGAVITPVAAFAGAAVISMGSAGTTQHGGQRITGITIDGSDLPAGNTVNGIESVGFVGGVKIRDTVVWGNYNSGTTKGLGGRGLYAHNDGTAGHNPDFWQVDGCHFSQCGIAGAELVALADSWVTNSEAVGNNGDGWRITNGSGSRYIGCRGDSNSNGTGWALTGGVNFTGSLQFTNIEANLDSTGLAISGTGTGTYYLSLFKSTGNTANYSYAGTMNVKSDAAYNTSTAAPTLS